MTPGHSSGQDMAHGHRRVVVTPVHLVILFIGAVLIISVVGIIVLAATGNPAPQELGTVCIASMTALGGLLAPNTGLFSSGRTAQRASLAGEAAARAVVNVSAEADYLAEHNPPDPLEPPEAPPATYRKH